MMEEKRFPRYDDSAHIDSAAVEHKKKPPVKTYSDEYAKKMEK